MKLKGTKLISVFLVSCLLTISVGFTSSMPAAAASAPPYTVTRYVSNPNNATTWGDQAGDAAVSQGLSDEVIILDFGEPETWTVSGSTVYGTAMFDSNYTKITTAQIATYVENFLTGFWCNTTNQFITLCIGTNNYTGCTETTAHGQAGVHW